MKENKTKYEKTVSITMGYTLTTAIISKKLTAWFKLSMGIVSPELHRHKLNGTCHHKSLVRIPVNLGVSATWLGLPGWNYKIPVPSQGQRKITGWYLNCFVRVQSINILPYVCHIYRHLTSDTLNWWTVLVDQLKLNFTKIYSNSCQGIMSVAE